MKKLETDQNYEETDLKFEETDQQSEILKFCKKWKWIKNMRKQTYKYEEIDKKKEETIQL